MIRLSSGLRDAVITNYGLGVMMIKGHIQVYSGLQPASADLPPTGRLLGFITQGGLRIPMPGDDAGGLMLQSGRNAGELINAGEWVLRGAAVGAPGWWRFVAAPMDAGQESDFLCRIDGSAGDSISPLLPAITASTVLPLAGFLISLPHQ